MSESEKNVRDALAALIEGQLSPQEQAAMELQIQQAPAVCEEWSALLRQDVLLHELLTEERYSKTKSWPTMAIINRAIFVRFAAVAAMVAIAVLTWMAIFVQAPAAPITVPSEAVHATVFEVAGTVQIEKGGEKSAAAVGQTVHAGESVVTGENSRVELRFADGSQFSADHSSKLTWRPSTNSNLVFELEAGSVSAAIQKQHGHAFVLGTAHSLVKVIGTRFRLSCNATLSTLEMFEGRVLCQRRADGVEIPVVGEQRVSVGADASQPFAPVPLFPELPKPATTETKRALLVTAEPLPFYAHDVAIQRLLLKFGLQVELTTFDKIMPELLSDKALVIVSSHACKHDKVLRRTPLPVIAWHNVWHQDLGLIAYDTPVDHRLSSRNVSWTATVPQEFQHLAAEPKNTFALNIYSSVPSDASRLSVLTLNGPSQPRSALALYEKSSVTAEAGRRAAFSIDIREGAGNGAPVELSEELFVATLRWCLREEPNR